ncbi:MAG: YfhO family protein, partial [Actinomycetota bacterium]|nr:YfhO family protein [Actinomycetota bacterium]
PTEIELEARAAAPAVLVASELDYPGWKAEVDGEERPIMLADGFLRAVEVPAGTHRVEMTYRPTHWTLALVLTIGGALAVLAACGVALLRARS